MFNDLICIAFSLSECAMKILAVFSHSLVTLLTVINIQETLFL